jgi:hypothetical protein
MTILREQISATGQPLPADATEFAGILNLRDQIVTMYASDRSLTQKNAEKACTKLASIPGYTPWELISDKDAELIIDRRFYNPTVDPEQYPHIVSDWHWTRTPDASSPADLAWYVLFGSGYVFRNNRYFHGRALAVCRPLPASQQ